MAARKQSYTLEQVELRINGNIIGGAQSATFTASLNNKVLREGGSNKAREILSSEFAVSGSLERLHIDSDLIKETIDIENGEALYFDFSGVVKGKTPERSVTVVDAMFEGFEIPMSLTDGTIYSQNFVALDIKL